MEVTLEVNKENVSISILNKENVLASTGMNYDGFCVSPNKALWALFET